MAGLEVLGWMALASMVPGAIFIGIGLAVWEHENGGPPEWAKKLGDFLVKISEKYFE